MNIPGFSEFDLGYTRIRRFFVYVLLHGDFVVYVGRTTNLEQRMLLHFHGTKLHRAKSFTRSLWMEVHEDDAAAYEGALIRYFDPPLCSAAPSDGGRDEEIWKRLGLQVSSSKKRDFVRRLIGRLSVQSARRSGRRRKVGR